MHTGSLISTTGTAGGFQPDDIAGLKLWLDADLGITLTSGKVSTWADQSGNGNNVVQGTAANRFVVNATGINGKQTLTSDALGFMENTGVELTPDKQDKTFFCIVKPTADSTGRLLSTRATGNGSGIQISPTIALTDQATFNDSWVTPLSTTGVVYVYMMLIPNAGPVSVKLNNVNQPLSTTTVPAETGSGGFLVGGFVAIGQPLLAEQRLYLLYDSILSPSDQATVYDYCLTRI